MGNSGLVKFFKHEDSNVDLTMNRVSPRFSAVSVVRPNAKFVLEEFDSVMDKMPYLKLDKTVQKDRKILGELVLRYIFGYDYIKENPSVTLTQENDQLWQKRHGNGHKYDFKRATLAVKYIFIALILIFVIMNIVVTIMDLDASSELDTFHEVIEIIEVIAFVMIGIVMIKAMMPTKAGFYKVIEPIDMFVAFIAGILLIITAIKNTSGIISGDD
jgi:hypothetical protein